MYSRPHRRPRPISTARLPLLTALGFAGLIGVSAPPLTARQEPEPSSQSADRKRVERLSQRASERVQALQAEADELASRQRTLLEEIRRLELDRQVKTTELNAIDQELAETTDSLDEATDRIARIEQEAAAERPLVEARLDATVAEFGTDSSHTGSEAMYFELRFDGRPVDQLEWTE